MTTGPPGAPASRATRAAIAAVAFALVLAGCSVRATVHVVMRADGSGTVQAAVLLDTDAVQAAEAGAATLQQRVRLADLHTAGWAVSPWVTTKTGGATLTVTKHFTSPDQVAGIARELSGPTGPLRTLTATRDTAWLGLGHRARVDVVVDLHDAQPGVTTDQQLVTRLAGQHVDVNAINLQLVDQLRHSFSVQVVAQLPGRRQTVIVPPGSRRQLRATATALDTTRVALLGAALVLVLLAGLVAWRARRRPRPRRRPAHAP
ncbi:MAG TPA: hypothetical protein VLV81_12080 [Acidimicrobiia bacterium]|nr:hypothetical protein [Acidimicrobiia bacterium]